MIEAAVETFTQNKPIKFAFVSGALAVVATVLASLSFGFLERGHRADPQLLITSAVFALPMSLAPYLAGRMNWLTPSPSLGRSFCTALPLAFVPVGSLLGLAGWGDPQEHLIRRILHATHREIPDHLVGSLIVFGIILFGSAAVGLLSWISVSVSTNKWRARMLVVVLIGCALLSTLSCIALFAGNDRSPVSVVTLGLTLVFGAGFLFALAIHTNLSPQRVSLLFRAASGIAVIGLMSGMTIVFAKSSPEKRFPTLPTGPLWKLDIASTACRPSWGGPNSYAAPNEIAFASNSLLGMAFETSATALPSNKWEYKACVFTVDVATGAKIAQVSIDGNQPIINGNTDGHFEVLSKGLWTPYTADLKPAGQPRPFEKSNDGGTAAKWHNFRSDSHGKLLFDDPAGTRILAQFPGEMIYIHPLGVERVLVLGGHQFSLFRADGTLISTETFLREGVNFAALCADHHRFAVAVYLWGVGDPSYLEEEKIVVYDADSGKAVASVPSDPLPRQQSWAALSPDGNLLAVGAQSTLRLFRLPPSAP